MPWHFYASTLALRRCGAEWPVAIGMQLNKALRLLPGQVIVSGCLVETRTGAIVESDAGPDEKPTADVVVTPAGLNCWRVDTGRTTSELTLDVAMSRISPAQEPRTPYLLDNTHDRGGFGARVAQIHRTSTAMRPPPAPASGSASDLSWFSRYSRI